MGGLSRRLEEILERLTAIESQGGKIMSLVSDVEAQLATVQATVQAQGAVIQQMATTVQTAVSAFTALEQQLATALANAQSAGLSAADLAEFQAINTSVQQNSAALAQQAQSLAAAAAGAIPPAPAPAPAPAPSGGSTPSGS